MTTCAQNDKHKQQPPQEQTQKKMPKREDSGLTEFNITLWQAIKLRIAGKHLREHLEGMLKEVIDKPEENESGPESCGSAVYIPEECELIELRKQREEARHANNYTKSLLLSKKIDLLLRKIEAGKMSKMIHSKPA